MQNVQWQHLNWAGIGFVFLMTIFLPACGGIIHLIRRSGRKTIKIRHTGPSIPKASPIPREFFYVPLPTPPGSFSVVDCEPGQFADWLPTDEEKLQGMMRDAPLRIVPRPHECTIDFERSKMVPIGGGAILAQCCVSGCTTIVRLGRNIVHASVEELIGEGKSWKSV